ncbi:MAG: L,D-transpeptidase [Gemmatimonadaceae bacterium]|nr:L,D-transpeptidase [Gemmatimonadaceae bacterium]
MQTVRTRFERDVARIVFNDNSEALEQVALEAGLRLDSLRTSLDSTPLPPNSPYIVVSIAERRLWYKQGDSVLFTAPVATGSGKQLAIKGANKVMRFETPRGRLVVQRLDSAPAWIPPDWHYQEQANKRKLGLVQLVRGKPLPLKDGSQITVRGNDVVRLSPDGATQPLSASDGREIVADGKIVIPPFGTNQRKYGEVLGSHRLYLGDGYGIHGTNNPASVGQAVSHGCVRMRNEDVATLYHAVGIGTPVFIY